MFGKRQERVLGGSKVRFGPSSILGTPSIPRGQCAPGLSRCTSQGAGFWRDHLVLHPFPDWGEGRPGRGGSTGVGARRGGAGPRPEMSSAPPGVARRLHQTPLRAPARTTSRQGPSGPACRFGQGRVSSGRAAAYASGGLHRGLLPPNPSEREPAASLPAPPAGPPAPRRPPLRAAPRGAARPDPGLAARETARRSDGYETGSLRPFRHRGHHRLSPSSAGPRAAAAAVTNRSAGLRATRSLRETGSATSQSRAV